MSDKACRDAAYRRRRVQRLKKLIILMLITAILVPWVLCVALLIRFRTLEQSIRELEKRLLLMQEQTASREAEHQDEESRKASEDTRDSQTLVKPSAEEAKREQAPEPEETVYKHKVYLTFDDGPSTNTDEILDILDRYGVKATFFVVGKEDEHSRERLRRIVEEGHTLGMHSYSHVYREIYSSEEAFAEDFQKLRQLLYDATGVECSHYRFPGGSSNTVSSLDMKVFVEYLNQEGVVFHDWNVSSGDAGSRLLDVDTVVNNCTRDILKRETSVVLLHDSADKPTTVEALPAIIETIQAMEDTVLLPVTEDMKPVQHIHVEVTEDTY
ncbi:MAG: polysaccharide deacetylase [Roseburia sp.]|nr:polysaccharide deacetylase [Roseburia sp.]